LLEGRDSTSNRETYRPAWKGRSSTITAAAGSVPGDVEFTIDCDYIREELHQSPGTFLLRVTNCTLFEIAPYTTDLALDGFGALDSGEFEILGAEIERVLSRSPTPQG
jgi:hypothetical protein